MDLKNPSFAVVSNVLAEKWVGKVLGQKWFATVLAEKWVGRKAELEATMSVEEKKEEKEEGKGIGQIQPR